MRIARVLIFFLLVLSISFSAEPPEPVVVLPNLGIEFLFIIAVVSVGAISITYMVGSSLQSPSITAWSKEQLREVVAGTILAVLLWGTVVVGASTILELYAGVDSFSELGNDALQDHIDYMETLYLKVADAYQTVGLLQGFSYFASIGIMWIYIGQGASPYYGASVLLGPLSNAANGLTLQILTLRLIKVFGIYVEGAFPDFILPSALALRIFPFTRKAGNTLIAISLGAMLVFPLSLIFVNEVWHATHWVYKEDVLDADFTYNDVDLGGIMDGVSATVKVLCSSSTLRTIFGLGEFGLGIIYATVACLPSGWGFFACFPFLFWNFVMVIWNIFAAFIYLAMGLLVLGVFATSFSSGVAPGLESIPGLLLPAVAEATGFSVIALFITVMITFTGIKSISAALGGEYILYGVSRFV